MTPALLLALALTAAPTTTVYQVPADFGTIAEAIAAASPDGTVLVAPGEYREKIRLAGSVLVVGEDPERCILQGTENDCIVEISGKVRIVGVTLRGGETGILVKGGSSLEVENCRILDHKGDGILFEDSFETSLLMRNCLVARTGDGIDLESTQAAILDSRFENNRDDGLDLDGDAGAVVFGCTFTDNGDDGIEVRLQERTHAIVHDCTFERNGEDGLEIIDSPLDDGIFNLLCVENSRFDGNTRHGVGFVRQQKPEEATDEMSKTAVYAAGNMFSGTGDAAVSANYAPVFEAGRSYPETVRATLATGEATRTFEIPVKMPVLVGVYDLIPTADGMMLSDAEGVTVVGDEVAVADDNMKAVYFLDAQTGRVNRVVPASPFPGGEEAARGPEGLSLVPYENRDALLLADDYGESLWTLSLAASDFGQVLLRQQTEAIGQVEGVEMFGNRMVLARRPDILEINPVNVEQVVRRARVSFDGFGDHIAGIGYDREGSRIFASLSGYTGASQKYRNHRSAFFTLDSDISEVTGFWHLGPFSNDPRGIAFSNGLVYIADGRAPFEDEKTGEMNRGGIKVLVFALDQLPELRPPRSAWSR